VSGLERLDEITRRLRRECPWDREQDERSIVPHTVEEAYELADAAQRSDDAKLLDELGDVLFQVHFLALLLEERGAGSLEQVAGGMVEKLIRRHPHVFGEAEARTAGQVLRQWDRIKREEEGRAGEPFADVPETLPALLYARKLQRRAASGGLEDPEQAAAPGEQGHLGALERARESLDRLAAAAPEGASAGPTADRAARDAIDAALGELLFAIVDVARRLRCDPELALRAASGRFRERIEQT
jgi:MazG family protein